MTLEIIKSLYGVFTALVTPFSCDGSEIDYKSFDHLVEWQISSGVNGLLVLGSTGEAATIEDDEKIKLVEYACKKIAGRVPLMVGLNYNCTLTASNMAQKIQKAGADLLLVNNPNYNKPSKNGIFHHFSSIHSACSLPIIIYNIPSRSIFDLSNQLIMKMFNQLDRVIGLKDCSGDVMRAYELSALAAQAQKNVALFCGDDHLGLSYCFNGGCGIISVLSNVFPSFCSTMYKHIKNGLYNDAIDIHKMFLPFYKALFAEPNPVPVKYVLHLLEKYNDTVRLPLLPISDDTRYLLKKLFD